MVMTIRVMSSGKGYEYLLKSVVVGDGDREMSSPLTRYYTESGCPPGTWVGTGLMSLDDGRTPALAEELSIETGNDGVVVSEATVKVYVDGERLISTAEGNGPVNALDNALRQALVNRYPQLADVALADYKVRILGWRGGTSATTRVLIDTTDGAAQLPLAPRTKESAVTRSSGGIAKASISLSSRVTDAPRCRARIQRNAANTIGPITANCAPTKSPAPDQRKRKPSPEMLSPVCLKVRKSWVAFQ